MFHSSLGDRRKPVCHSEICGVKWGHLAPRFVQIVHTNLSDFCYFLFLLLRFLVETGFHHVGQASLKLLTSDDPLTLAS